MFVHPLLPKLQAKQANRLEYAFLGYVKNVLLTERAVTLFIPIHQLLIFSGIFFQFCLQSCRHKQNLICGGIVECGGKMWSSTSLELRRGNRGCGGYGWLNLPFSSGTLHWLQRVSSISPFTIALQTDLSLVRFVNSVIFSFGWVFLLFILISSWICFYPSVFRSSSFTGFWL